KRASLRVQPAESDPSGPECSRSDRRHRGIRSREFHRRSAPAQHTREHNLAQGYRDAPSRFAFGVPPSDNLGMATSGDSSQIGAAEKEPFSPGALVIATLSNPREKFWGMILALAP